jgi:excisionase family DNA binding protein
VRQTPPIYTVEETASLLGISTSKVYRWIRAGELRTIQLGRGVAIPATALEQLLGTAVDEPSPDHAGHPDEGLNHVSVAGRLVADPELRTSRNGLRYSIMRLAIGRPGGGEPLHVVVVAFGPRADFAVSLEQGELVRVDGRLGQRDWTTEDGTRVGAQRVVAERVQALEIARPHKAAS